MSNKEVVSLECVVKSDSSVEQRVYLFKGSRAGVEPESRGGYLRASEASGETLWCTLFEGRIVEDCWEGVHIA